MCMQKRQEDRPSVKEIMCQQSMVSWAKKLNILIGARKIKNFNEETLATMSVMDTITNEKETQNNDKKKEIYKRNIDKKSYRYSARRRHE